MDKPKCWVKHVHLKVKVEVGLIFLIKFFGYVHILPNFGLKQPILLGLNVYLLKGKGTTSAFVGIDFFFPESAM